MDEGVAVSYTHLFKNVKTDREYDAIRLENEFIRVTVLPQLGGRIYEGYDKKMCIRDRVKLKIN